MNLNRLVITLLLCLSAASIYADRAEDLRESLPQLKGEKLIQAYGELYVCSLEGDDVDYQIKCVNDLIAESHRQGNHEKEGDARVQKMMLFYNVGINDSIYEQVHPTLDFLANIGDWKK